MKTVWFDEAWNDYVDWQTQDKKTLNRINQLIRGIASLVKIAIMEGMEVYYANHAHNT